MERHHTTCVRLLATAALFVTAACGSDPESTPLAPVAPAPPTTLATPPRSGRIDDIQAARDIIAWNMDTSGGASFRRRDVIARWELPVPVRLAESVDRAAARDALGYWQHAAGISYVLVDSETLPRLLIRLGMDGLAPHGGGRAVIDGTYPDNRVRSGLVVFEPGGGTYCTDPAGMRCRYLYRHEIGHALGFIGHSDGGLMSGGPDVLSSRELNMIRALYTLPHGARVEADGTWRVVTP